MSTPSPSSALSSPPHGTRRPPGRVTQTRALVVLVVLAVLFTLHVASTFVLPVVLTIVLALVLRPLVVTLARWRIPTGVSAAVLVLLLLGGGGLAVGSLYRPAMEWVHRAPLAIAKIERTLREFRRPMEEAGQAAEQVRKLAQTDDQERAATPVEVREPGLDNPWIEGATVVLGNLVVMTFLLFFMLATGGSLLNRIARFAARSADVRSSEGLVTEIERQVSRYLGTVTAINAGLGMAVGGALWLIGLPNAFMWGVLVAFLNYIPYLGGAVGVCLVTLAASLAFNDWENVVAAPGAYVALNTLEGMLVTPTILGRRFALDPCFVFIWLVFWSWTWGIPGAVLAMPLLTVVKIISERIGSLRPLARLISPGEALPEITAESEPGAAAEPG